MSERGGARIASRTPISRILAAAANKTDVIATPAAELAEPARIEAQAERG